MIHARRLFALSLAIIASAACAGAGGTPEAQPAPSAPPSAARPAPKPRIDELAAARVYDAAGHAGACAPPQATCPPADPDRAFLDRCRMAGFQIRQCGCEQRCSGDVAAANRRWDAAGNVKECAPARADCTPPPAGAAFQDACAEKGFRLDICGCEWLCSGNPKK